MSILITTLTLLVELFALEPWTILRRHDRDDSRYLALATRYAPAICQVGYATGTLITDRWIITAAHVVRNISPFSRSAVCGSEHRAIKATYALSAITLRQLSAAVASIDDNVADLALVELETPVRIGLPVHLNHDTKEKGKSIVVVGGGVTGTGETGPDAEDGKLRAATNVIDEATGQYIRFSFSPPDDPTATDLEGIGGPGDSGGPAFIERKGQLYIVGVSSINSRNGATGPSRYKSIESYSRISTNLRWINAVMRHEIKADSVAEIITDVRNSWPDTHGAHLAESWVSAFNSRDSLSLIAFEQRYRADSLLTTKPAAARVATWHGLNDQWGNLRPAAFTQIENRVMLLVEAPKPGYWMRIEFILDDASKIARMRTATPEDPFR